MIASKSSSSDFWIKIEIREDPPANVVRAFFIGEKAERVEMSTLALGIVNNQPEVFDAWKAMLKLSLKCALDEQGIPHHEPIEIKPSSMN